MIAPTHLDRMFGEIDIYLFDQILKGRIPKGSRILDAGCGNGRNIHYLMDAGYEIAGLDTDPQALADVMRLAARLNASLPPGNFRLEAIEGHSFPEEWFDVVLCVAVLHFATNDAHFGSMVRGLWRAVKPGGLLFCRLASSIGMSPSKVTPLGNRRFKIPDGSERYLVDEAILMELTERLGGKLLEPLKTTIVQDQRCMTTWVVRKND